MVSSGFVLYCCVVICSASNGQMHDNESITLKVGLLGSSVIDRKDTQLAMKIVEQKLRRDEAFPPNVKLQIIQKDVCPFVGPAYEAANIAAQMRLYDGADVIIGPPCSEGVAVISRLAVHWNIPVIGFLSMNHELANKKLYKTLARVSLTTDKVGQATAAVINHFGWKKVAIVTNLDGGVTAWKYKSTVQKLDNYGIQVTAMVDVGSSPSDKQMQTALKTLRENARIIILIIEKSRLGPTTQKFLLAAQRANMTGSEYFYLIPASYGAVTLISPKVIEPLHSVMLIYHRGYDPNLIENLLEELSQQRRNGSTSTTIRTAMPFLPLLHDSLYLYGTAVSKSFAKSGLKQIRNGTALWKLMTNLQFNGSSGPVKMDNNAERLPMFYVSTLMKDTKKWTVVITVETNTDKTVVHHDNDLLHHENLPYDTPNCGFKGEICEENYTVTLGFLFFLVLIFILGGTCYYFMNRRKQRRLRAMPWRISSNSIGLLRNLGSVASHRSLEIESSAVNYKNSWLDSNVKLAFVNGEMAIMYKYQQKRPVFYNKDELQHLNCLKSVHHDFLNSFIGLCFNDKDSLLIACWSLQGRGTLKDILSDEDFKFEDIFRRSFIRDINKGLEYIHRSSISYHGNLNCVNCLITNHWTVKLSNFGLNPVLYRLVQEQILEFDTESRHELLHIAPELLKERQKAKVPIDPTREGDIYSFGTLIYGILFRTEPYHGSAVYQNDIINKLCNPRYNFVPPLELPNTNQNDAAFVALLKLCLNGDPAQRPNARDINRVLENELKREQSVVDHMTMLMELHAENLERLVKERTALLEEAQRRADALLYQLLPRRIAETLKAGHQVEPKTFPSATVYFNDIMNFTKFCSESSPLEIVTFLNDLYSSYDAIIEQHNVYKVETIGDSYMVVSGVPEQNGDRHVAEIASMADQIRRATSSFVVLHKNDYKVLLRSGFHSGPVATGVIGLKAPKYCLFGDTVNTASRMESTGIGMGIQTSGASMDLLKKYPQFTLEERGEICVKGKGQMKTYWLTGKK